jgi:D-tyrosyl-tRNA(Tyr) deacylase
VRILVQRVSRASVRVEGRTVSSIGRGVLVLLAIERGDTPEIVDAGARKVGGLRIFPDPGDTKMNRSVIDSAGEALVVSQFTLAATVRRGRRPSFENAAPPELASSLCQRFATALSEQGLKKVGAGVFGAMMEVELVNDGPVTIWLQSTSSGEIGP